MNLNLDLDLDCFAGCEERLGTWRRSGGLEEWLGAGWWVWGVGCHDCGIEIGSGKCGIDKGKIVGLGPVGRDLVFHLIYDFTNPPF